MHEEAWHLTRGQGTFPNNRLFEIWQGETVIPWTTGSSRQIREHMRTRPAVNTFVPMAFFDRTLSVIISAQFLICITRAAKAQWCKQQFVWQDESVSATCIQTALSCDAGTTRRSRWECLATEALVVKRSAWALQSSCDQKMKGINKGQDHIEALTEQYPAGFPEHCKAADAAVQGFPGLLPPMHMLGWWGAPSRQPSTYFHIQTWAAQVSHTVTMTCPRGRICIIRRLAKSHLRQNLVE